ncbi:MAG: Arc family DNA binding domain-containing protein [Bacteroidota bacterium]|nr:Arc family DNA binding domain-containing protein [Bacteroidota bacterium]MDP4249507.1 Arc family DNA binding domain-containing protein [Bacteroidota bacterium]
MTGKKTFVLRTDEAVYKALEKWASDEFRSVNGQIEWLLQNQLKETGRIKSGSSTNTEKKKGNIR